jgi:hypothetical protein
LRVKGYGLRVKGLRVKDRVRVSVRVRECSVRVRECSVRVDASFTYQ